MAGFIVAVLSLSWVGIRLHTYWGDITIARISPLAWLAAAALAILYASSCLLLALAWRHLLLHFGEDVTRWWAVKIYGISQLAKYVPGNILQFAGRQALGMAANLRAKGLVKSIVYELALIAMAGATTSAWMLLPHLLPSLPQNATILPMLASLFFIGYRLRKISQQCSTAFVYHAFFLYISGAIFVALLNLVDKGSGLPTSYWMAGAGAYVAAWVAGLVTPGAPAGVGVREIVLLFLLHGLVADADLLVAIAASRLVSVGGDVLVFITATSMQWLDIRRGKSECHLQAKKDRL